MIKANELLQPRVLGPQLLDEKWKNEKWGHMTDTNFPQ
jgi:hypothetical protein